MKIFVLLNQPQFWLGIVGVIVWWIGYRLYVRVGRRCRKCGRWMWPFVRRISKIQLASDESTSLFSTKGKLRWWIRRVDTETFSICKCGWKESVKVSRGPISVWHARWTKFTNPAQYREDSELSSVSALAAFKRRQSVYRSLAEHADLDTPPVVSPLEELLEAKEDDSSN